MSTQPSNPNRRPFRVSASHERVLRALLRYERLTAEQTRRVLFGEGSLTYVQTKDKELADAGYVLAVPVGKPTPRRFGPLEREKPGGSGPLLYSLDGRGRAHLRALGLDVPRRLRQSDERGRSSPMLRHSIAVVDVLILGELLCRADPAYTLEKALGERKLKAHPIGVTLPDGATRGVALDAWMDLRVRYPDGIEQVCLGFEVDGHTEWQSAWREKVAALLALDRGPYTRAFGDETPLTIVVVAPTPERCRQLRAWTEQELIAENAEAKADLFRFGTMPADRADARSFFLAPRWHIPAASTPVPLLDTVPG